MPLVYVYNFPLCGHRPYAWRHRKGAPARWRSNEALPRAPSPSMHPARQPLHAISPGWPGPAHWLKGWAPTRCTTRARSATTLDPQHGLVTGDVTSMHKVYWAVSASRNWARIFHSVSAACSGIYCDATMALNIGSTTEYNSLMFVMQNLL